MIIESIVTAYDKAGNFIDKYTYTRPLDEIGKTCLKFWLDATEWLHPGCTFECVNLKNGVGEKFTLPKRENESSLF